MAKKSFIGVDLHTDGFVVCYLKQNEKPEYQKFALSKDGMRDFKKTLSKRAKVAIECVSNAAYFRDQIKNRVKEVVTVATGDFAVISKSVKKTDKHDAHALAKFLSKDMVPKARIKSETSRRLSSLIDTRRQFVKMKTSLVNKAHALLVQHGIKMKKVSSLTGFKRQVFIHKWKGPVKTELEVIYEQVQSLSESTNKLEAEIENIAKNVLGYENLKSIKGIGALSAAILLLVIDNIHDFEKPQNLASYFGIVPKVRQSNDNNPSHRITKKGSKIGRTTLVQCTWVAIKYSPYLKSYYERIKKRRGSGRAIIACSRKLLTIIFNTLKNNWIFDDFPSYKYHVHSEDKARQILFRPLLGTKVL